MRPTIKILGAGTLGILAGFAVGWLAREGRTQASAQATAAPSAVAGAVLPQLGQSGGGSQSASLRTLIEQLSYPEKYPALHQQFSLAQFETYLERHQRNAASLLAVYHITQDKALLREAYEKFPEDPLVATQALTSLPLSLEERLAMLEKVRLAHPKDALTDFLASGTLIKEGRIDEALRFLQDGLDKPGLDFGWNEQALDAREALMAAGKSPTEARVLGLHVFPTVPREIMEISKQGGAHLKQLLQQGREDEAFALAGQMLALGRRVEEIPRSTVVGELIAHSFKARVLEALPKDVEIGDTGQTVEQWAQITEDGATAIRSSIEAINAGLTWHLQHLDDSGIELFHQITEARGYHAALDWAEAYHGPAPVPQK